MKNIIITTALLLSFSVSLMAQINRPNAARAQDRIKAYKIAFFTEKLQLTPEESKGFWPLYNQMEDDQKALREKYNLADKRLELLSDSEIESHLMKHLEAEEQMVKMRRDYVKRFMQVLPVRKVAMLQQVDNEFKRTLIEELRNRRGNAQGGQQGGIRQNRN